MRTIGSPVLAQLRQHATKSKQAEVLTGLRAQSTAALKEVEPDLQADPAGFFYARDLIVEPRATPLPRTPLQNLSFGTEFTDHMFHIEHVVGEGWGIPKIVPFGFIPVHPAAQVLHNGMSCFEGMKAYRGADGRGYLFRPDANMARFYSSSRRLGLADFDPQELLECLKALIRVDSSWIPDQEGYSLYLRPFMWASSYSLGVTPATRTTLSIIMSPVGPYFPTGLQPIRLFLNQTHVRAWPGGVGDSKVASNYGPTIVPAQQAAQAYGTPQALYTLPHGEDPDDATVSEVGAMNIFFLLDKADGSGLELVTPPLDGTILPGITRDSILHLARSWREFQVSERPLTVRELSQASEQGRLRECFGAGTACIVQPVEALVRASGEDIVTRPEGGSLVSRVHRSLTDIQHAKVPSPWSVPIN